MRALLPTPVSDTVRMGAGCQVSSTRRICFIDILLTKKSEGFYEGKIHQSHPYILPKRVSLSFPFYLKTLYFLSRFYQMG